MYLIRGIFYNYSVKKVSNDKFQENETCVVSKSENEDNFLLSS